MGIFAGSSQVPVAYTLKFLHAIFRDCCRKLKLNHELNELNKSLKFMSLNDVHTTIGYNRLLSVYNANDGNKKFWYKPFVSFESLTEILIWFVQLVNN